MLKFLTGEASKVINEKNRDRTIKNHGSTCPTEEVTS